jgi:hypothetical protein
MVASRYVPLQNTEALEFFDPLLRTGWAALETVGALGDGETVWVQAHTRHEVVEERLATQAAVDPTADPSAAWGVYNAITWVEDKRARASDDPEQAVNSIWFGNSAEKKARRSRSLATSSARRCEYDNIRGEAALGATILETLTTCCALPLPCR